MQLVNRFIRNIKNLIYWFPVIWRDRNFDEVYIYEILLHKLKSVQKTFSNSDEVVEIEETRKHILRYITIAVKLLERIIEDDYITPADREVYRSIKVEWIECEDNPDLLEMKTIYRPPREVMDDIHMREDKLRTKTLRIFHLVLMKRMDRWFD